MFCCSLCYFDKLIATGSLLSAFSCPSLIIILWESQRNSVIHQLPACYPLHYFFSIFTQNEKKHNKRKKTHSHIPWFCPEPLLR